MGESLNSDTMQPFIPETINEIMYQKMDRRERIIQDPCTTRFGKFHKGEKVEFNFGEMTRVGHISNCFCKGGIISYHIVTFHGTWYRDIQQDQIRKLSHD